jgi:hypothetical protein
MSEEIKEIRFIYYFLSGMGVEVKLTIVVTSDNVGAIVMAENSSSEVRTRHIDTRYHFVLEHVEDGFIKIVFVESEDNNADIITKNVGEEGYEKHVSNFLGKVEKSNH